MKSLFALLAILSVSVLAHAGADDYFFFGTATQKPARVKVLLADGTTKEFATPSTGLASVWFTEGKFSLAFEMHDSCSPDVGSLVEPVNVKIQDSSGAVASSRIRAGQKVRVFSRCVGAESPDTAVTIQSDVSNINFIDPNF